MRKRQWLPEKVEMECETSVRVVRRNRDPGTTASSIRNRVENNRPCRPGLHTGLHIRHTPAPP